MQEHFWLDYGFRQYDPQIARWHVTDALAESYLSHSPYAYVMNNPINKYDVAGLLSRGELGDIIIRLMNSPYGGEWSSETGMINYFSSTEDAIVAGSGYASDWGYSGTSPGGGSRPHISANSPFGNFLWNHPNLANFLGFTSYAGGWTFSWWNNNPHEFPERSQGNMLGTQGLDWGITPPHRELSTYKSSSGIDRNNEIRYYWCPDCLGTYGNGMSNSGTYLWQKPVVLRSKVYTNMNKGVILPQSNDRSYEAVTIGINLSAFVRTNDLTLDDFYDIESSSKLHSAVIQITINPSVPGFENLSDTKRIIEKKYKGTKVEIIKNPNRKFNDYHIQIITRIW